MKEIHTKMESFQRFILEYRGPPSNIPDQQQQEPGYEHLNQRSPLTDPTPYSPGDSDNSIDQHVPMESAQCNLALNLDLPTIQ